MVSKYASPHGTQDALAEATYDLSACILARVPDPGAERVPELMVIVRGIAIAQVTHGEEGCQPP